ncbi:GNAT family N-acetyltransferase [Oceanobacillus bengalensis]|uniref:N-acetyltransferase n=1 Tax=Oceanobacillus bengalensis TaxID=1435466 RepID=A0A494Z0W5_9BACI|nr:GNAT family N-acetyltransferase [Oceanobacillus bengalensis]RKQ16100.1 N-acetyltransferase [Oceanobacillus bengalensis]
MLIRFKKNLEKIAMGLLSFMPEVKKDVKKLQQLIKEYETNPNWHLYLWKEVDDVIGIIGLRMEDDTNVIIQHISVNPSYRNMGIGKRMIIELKGQYQNKYTVLASTEVEDFYKRCKDTELEMEEQ